MKSDLKSVIENVAYKLILDYCLPLKLFKTAETEGTLSDFSDASVL